DVIGAGAAGGWGHGRGGGGGGGGRGVGSGGGGRGAGDGGGGRGAGHRYEGELQARLEGACGVTFILGETCPVPPLHTHGRAAAALVCLAVDDVEPVLPLVQAHLEVELL